MAPEPPRKRPTKRAELAAWWDRVQPRAIGESEFEELRRFLAPVSGNYLRKLLRESGVPLTAMVEGVRQGSFDELETSLLALLEEYEPADAARRIAVRRLVIAAKDHARWAGRRAEKRDEKGEMVLWMLTWLENPTVFREWVNLRRRISG